MPVPHTTGRHRSRRRGGELPGRPTLLAIAAALCLALGSGTAFTLTTVGSLAPPAAGPAGSGALAPAPSSPAPPGTAAPTPPTSAGRAASPSPAAAPQPSAPSRSRAPDRETVDEITTLEDRVTALTNAERAAAGCGDLRTDERLRAAARGHSRDMAEQDYFSHTSLDGRSPSDRAGEAGYDGGVGENIAMGYPTPEEVVRGWMNSDGHRANLLNCAYAAIGVGLAYDGQGRAYWTQNFGRH